MPRQIASDLRQYFNLDIRDWHLATRVGGQLLLSSRALLELFGASIESHPDTGNVDPDCRVYVRQDGVLSRRRYGDLALNGTREICIEFPPENGAVDKTMRDGGFNRVEAMAAATFNELALVRLWIHAGNGGREYEPPRIDDPREERAKGEQERKKQEFRSRVEADMFSGFEW